MVARSSLAAPPRRIRRLLWRERSFQLRRTEFADEWLPLPGTAAVLVVASTTAFAMFLPLLGAGIVWVAGDSEAACRDPASAGTVVEDACHWITGLLMGERVQDLPGVVEAGAWFGTSVALVGGLVLLLLHIRSEEHRRRTWRVALWYEYASWRDGRAERTWGGIVDLGWARKLVRLLWGTRRGDPEGRLKHARRWAWANEAFGQLAVIGMVLFGTICAGLLLWQSGAIAADRPVLWPEAAAAAGHDLAWNLARSIPILEITDTLKWKRPTLFADDRTWSVLLLFVKLAVFIPMIAYFVQLMRQRRDDSEPTSPIDGRPVVGAVIDALAAASFPAYQVLGGGWPRLYSAAAARLNSSHVPPPPGSNRWTPAAVARELPNSLRGFA